MAGEIRFTIPRDAQGQFRKVEADLKNLMLTEARQFQTEVAQYQTTHLKRKGDSTGVLASTTQKPGNREVLATTWRVGIPSFLDQSAAKYWRLIEQGSAGLYAHGHGFRGTPLRFRKGGFPGGRQFRSIGANNAHLPNDVWRGTGGDRVRVQSLVFVRNEIQPMNAYRIVFEENGWRQRTQRDFELIVRKGFNL